MLSILESVEPAAKVVVQKCLCMHPHDTVSSVIIARDIMIIIEGLSLRRHQLYVQAMTSQDFLSVGKESVKTRHCI